MNKKQLIKWIIPVIGRGIAWIAAAWLSVEAAESEKLGVTIAEALGAIVLVVLSSYTSIKGRKKLLDGS
jgi:hypothetical protein